MSDRSAIRLLLHETASALKTKAASSLLCSDERILTSAFADEILSEAEILDEPTSNKSLDVRGLRYGPMLLGGEGDTLPLLKAVRNTFGFARWTEFYRQTPWSHDFLERFATGECLGSSGRFMSERLIIGLFILGPETFYPAHAHAAEEFYLVVEGEAEFQNGASAEFMTKRKGDLVLHGSEVSHAIRTSSKALLAVYGWRGNLKKPSWYRDNMADDMEQKNYPILI